MNLDAWVSTHTALPNLHPALVHFPLAVFPMGVVLDLAALIWAGARGWLRRAATVLWVAGALGALAAYLAGRQAADSVGDVEAAAGAAMARHADWGTVALWIVLGLASLRLIAARKDPDGARGSLSLGLALVGLLGCGVLAYTADLGGALVFEHGVAVARPAAPATPEPVPAGPDPGPPGDRLTRGTDGSLTWRPLAADTGALGTVMTSPDGSAAAVTARPPDPARGLNLEVQGAALLLFEDDFGDVKVEAEIDVSKFQGTVGLVHHARDASTRSTFAVEVPRGHLGLTRHAASATGPELLDEALRELAAGPLQLSVSSAGRHLRGTVAGRLGVHGHAPPPPPGRCGLWLDGRGTVRVMSVGVTPIAH